MRSADLRRCVDEFDKREPEWSQDYVPLALVQEEPVCPWEEDQRESECFGG